MLASLRAGLTAALLLVSSLSALSADKPYHRDDLAEAAVRVEGQIKADAGAVAKPLAALRRDADTAVARRNQDGALDMVCNNQGQESVVLFGNREMAAGKKIERPYKRSGVVPV